MAASPDSFVARHFKSTAPMKQATTIVPVQGYESTTSKRTDRMEASPDSFVARRFKSTVPMKQAAPIVPVRGYESILPRTDRMAASLIHLLPVTLKAPRR